MSGPDFEFMDIFRSGPRFPFEEVLACCHAVLGWRDTAKSALSI